MLNQHIQKVMNLGRRKRELFREWWAGNGALTVGDGRQQLGRLDIQICVLALKLRYRRNQSLILLVKSRYRLCLARKRLVLFVRGCLIRLNLLACKRKLIAKHGPNWRLCLFDYEVVEFLKLVEYAHRVMRSNDQAQRPGT